MTENRYSKALLVTGAASVVLAYVVWLHFVWDLRRWSHDGIGEGLLLLTVVSGWGLGAWAATLTLRQKRGWGYVVSPFVVTLLVPAGMLFGYSRLDSVQRAGADEQYAIDVFNNYTGRIPHGLDSVNIVWGGPAFTSPDRTLMVICGYRRERGRTPDGEIVVGVNQDKTFCGVVDLQADPQVIGGYKRDETTTPELYDCFGVAKPECSYLASMT